MKKPNEDDILETTLSIAEKGYPEAYRFLLNAYEESPSSFGPQTFYFLACLGWRRQYAGFGFGVAEKGDSRE